LTINCTYRRKILLSDVISSENVNLVEKADYLVLFIWTAYWNVWSTENSNRCKFQ